MNTSGAISLTGRDRAVLRAVADGRCRISAGACPTLTIDGVCCCDQFAANRLTGAGLIAEGDGPAHLTDRGLAMLSEAA
jgi:hypothetical protein